MTNGYNRYQLNLGPEFGMFTLRVDDYDEFKAELTTITGRSDAADAILAHINRGLAKLAGAAHAAPQASPPPDKHDVVVQLVKDELGAKEVDMDKSPRCAGHGVPMALRSGNKGQFWACQGKDPESGKYAWQVGKGCKTQNV